MLDVAVNGCLSLKFDGIQSVGLVCWFVTRLLFLTAFSYTGYPRLPQKSQTPIRPFTLQDSRFTATNRILNDTNRIILIPQLDVPFLLRNQGSRLTPLRALQFSVVGGVSSGNMPEAVRQLTNPKTIMQSHRDKNSDFKRQTNRRSMRNNDRRKEQVENFDRERKPK
jgi:hypothetical protein